MAGVRKQALESGDALYEKIESNMADNTVINVEF
jgi:hypothetical protein